MVKTLTNFDIDRICGRWGDYGGCFSVHQVNKRMCKDGMFYILNLDWPSNEGSHWTLLDLTDKKTNMYYDSYANFPPSEIEKYLNNSPKDFVINRLYDSEQSLDSNTCGYFCIFIMLLRKAGFSPRECLEYMTNDGIGKNEEMMRYFYSLIKKNLVRVR